ncbi:septation protein SepH [Arcanobacterium pinnipediorum]|uniref:Septation protein SepH n=1 Tax=Arcanobacterium pinnipediorum TaxID=1503041 RepID=A0ABY5AIS9_9ACTO|nr:septation protein SepH [Arcanobacterium pinnipediorum]USR80124.1 septation protein SepH [Arcanobacterium pinnipediorum]
MIELELLGILPDGNQLSLNDAEGNRYILPITDSLRAALRKDTSDKPPAEHEPKPISPREIQAHIRAGMTIAEVSELSTLPASQVSTFAHPIFAEREYTAQRAKNFRQGADIGSMTIEELVVSRLIPRGVLATDITWDATRTAGDPWVLSARYTIAGQEHHASWIINTRSQSVEATNDEALWLTETQIPAPTSPWRPLNTPRIDDAGNPSSAASSEPEVATSKPKLTALDAQPASAGTPSIDDMLASLDSQRGKNRKMPGEDFFDGAHRAVSDTDSTHDATILELPQRSSTAKPHDNSDSPATAPTADSADSNELPLGRKALERTQSPKRRRNRPAMPSWDEIVFGSPKE